MTVVCIIYYIIAFIISNFNFFLFKTVETSTSAGVSADEPVFKKPKITTTRIRKTKNTNVDDLVSKINVFRREDRQDPDITNFLENVYNNSPFYIQMNSDVVSVPKPTFEFNMDDVPTLKMSEQLNTTVPCNHEFQKYMEQTRSSDELVTLYKICKLCRIIKTN